MTITTNRKWPFIARKPAKTVPIHAIKEKALPDWLKKQHKPLQTRLKHANFCSDGTRQMVLFKTDGTLNCVYVIVKDESDINDGANLAQKITARLAEATLKTIRFEIKGKSLSGPALTRFLIGWGIFAYKFDTYKSNDKAHTPILLWPKNCDRKRVEAHLDAMALVRDLINTPAFDMGPEELEKSAKSIARTQSATTRVIKDAKLLEKNFPLIHAVGMAAAKTRRPRLIDIKWGKKSHPKVTLVGKGVCFDTGGLDLKPSQYMKHMKKDMGGAAHALALAHMIMDLNLPIQLRVLIPAVENSVAGDSFRPGDIFKSRKGHFVENTNTDAEGRLILADSLTHACEDKPDLVIDFATLTGSARAALGQDIPAMFSTNDKTAQDIQTLSFEANDPLWQMPLHKAYNKHIENSTGDLVNSAGLPGDLIYSALFLNKFISDEQEWVHLDLFAWEPSGSAARTKGGTDMSLRSMFEYLEKRYG